MKVLWFEVTEPSGYRDSGSVIGGWQDSLENIVRKYDQIDLYIVFEGKSTDEIVTKNGVTYIPVPTIATSFKDRLLDSYSWKRNENRIVKESIKVIETVKPDIIHIFGMEWPWGSVVKYTNVPCVVHIMGSIIPYYNSFYPPRYSWLDMLAFYIPNILKTIRFYLQSLRLKSNVKYEKQRWNEIKYYMGRTVWDKAMVNTLHPGAKYYHVDEALRAVFIENEERWKCSQNTKIKLISTGCRNFWKGPDMMLKTASVLKNIGVDFEWDVVGSFPEYIQRVVEKKEGLMFSENNIHFLGYKTPDSLCDLLCRSDMYVHTAYIENSPNSICEAQIIGIPIISTNVGGISTLLGENGVLVPANDPWQMANAIVELAHDKSRMNAFSENGKKVARQRHNPDKIYKELLECYKDIIKDY